MATIGDVAKLAGVAKSTVSAVINGGKYVRPETRDRVIQAIVELDFTVNRGARALATSKTLTLGLLVQFNEAEFAPAMNTYVVALSDAAHKNNYRILLLPDRDDTAAIRQVKAERVVDGLIPMNVLEDDPRIDALHATKIPAVLLGMPSEDTGFDAVDLNFSGAAKALVERVESMGVSRVALIGWPENVYESKATYAVLFRESVRETAQQLQLELVEHYVSVNPAEARSALQEIFSRADFDAAIFHNDAAVAMMPQLLSSTPIPRENIVSLHSSELARMFAIPFFAVESEPDVIADSAVTTLITRIENRDKPITRKLFAPEWIVGTEAASSTAHRTGCAHP